MKKYSEIDALTPAVVNEFIERINVHAPDKSSGHRSQQIDIVYNFIGMLPTPRPERSSVASRLRRFFQMKILPYEALRIGRGALAIEMLKASAAGLLDLIRRQTATQTSNYAKVKTLKENVAVFARVSEENQRNSPPSVGASLHYRHQAN